MGDLIIGAIIFYLFCTVAMSVVFYMLYGFGLHGMLKSCGYKKPWHAFVPFFRVFALGCLSDVYNDERPSQKNRGTVLLWLAIAAIVLQIGYTAAYLLHIFPIFNSYLPRFDALLVGEVLNEDAVMLLYEEFMTEISVLPSWLDTLSLISSAAELVYFIFTCLALNKVLKIFAPERSGVYVVLSILFEPARAIIFFILRKRAPQNLRWQTPPPADDCEQPPYNTYY